MRIGIDIDLTVVDTGVEWLKFLEKKSGRQVQMPKDAPYNIGHLFPEVSNEDSMSFWNCERLYDEMNPIEGSKGAIARLHEDGHEIIFVSHVIGNHLESKRRFVNFHFPYNIGFIATREKQLVNIDVMIDDRINILNACKAEGIFPLQFKTRYDQCEGGDHYHFNRWEDFHIGLIEDLYYGGAVC